MRQNHTAPAYHNAFYWGDLTDKQKTQKKHTESSSFAIRGNYRGLIVARSYYTDIAVIDNNNKVLLITAYTYSNTTAGQKSALRSACPSHYAVCIYDDAIGGADYMDSDRIASIRTEMNKKANDFFAFDEDNNPTRKYLAKEDREWVQHQTNLLSESKAYKVKDVVREVQRKREIKRHERAQKAEQKRIERQQSERAYFAEVFTSCGRNETKARAITGFRFTFDGGRGLTDILQTALFVWDGKPESVIRTTQGVGFRLKDCVPFIKYESWKIGDMILGSYQYNGRYAVKNAHGANDDDREYLQIGCHKILIDDLNELREMITDALKAKAGA